MAFNLLAQIDIGGEATKFYPAVSPVGPTLSAQDTNPETLHVLDFFIQRGGSVILKSVNNACMLTITDANLYVYFKSPPKSSSWSGLPEIAAAAKRAAGQRPATMLAGRLALVSLNRLAARSKDSQVVLAYRDGTVDPAAQVLVVLGRMQRGAVAWKALDPRPIAADIHRRAMTAKKADPRFAAVDVIQEAGPTTPFGSGGPKTEEVGYKSVRIA